MVPSRLRSSSTRCLPMKPVSPVTKYLNIPPSEWPGSAASLSRQGRVDPLARARETTGEACRKAGKWGEGLRKAPSRRRRPAWRAVTPAHSGGAGLWLRRCSVRTVQDRKLTLTEAAQRAGVSPSTLRRWAETGVIPEVDGRADGWTEVAAAHARIVARLRERGHSLKLIKEASRQGRLAYGFVEDLFPRDRDARSLEDAAEETGLEPALIERFMASIGLPPQTLEHITDEDVHALQYVAAVLAAGFPLVAFLQLCRVYGQTLAQIADAEVRLFHIYVHQRFLHHYLEQDVVGHMEMELGEEELGRLRVAIAFADLAGYTRFTEEEGEEEALSFVERFVEGVVGTLPAAARLVKTIGDEVMVVGQDVGALTDWAVAFMQLLPLR